jgi:NitT/TauT family transport system substrate-binding protein
MKISMRSKLVALVFGLMALVLSSWSCFKGEYSGKVESITIGTLPYEGSALIYIAEEQKLFKANGLDIIIKDYETGLATTDALNKGEADVAACAEFIIVGKAFQKEKILSIATIAKSLNQLIIGRTDKGIKTITDLKGKKIGVSRKTAAEFYFGRFLELNGMNIKQITLVDLLPSQLQEALAHGNVDAVIAWQPWASQIEKQVLNDKVVWPAQSNQLLYWNIIGRDTWVANHPELIKKLLSSLIQAEEYLVRHPSEAKAIVQTRSKYGDTYMAKVWPQQQSYVTLDQGLIAAMEDEARWMIKNNLTKEKQVLDFMNYIYVDGLKAIKPEAVDIIR